MDCGAIRDDGPQVIEKMKDSYEYINKLLATIFKKCEIPFYDCNIY